VPRYHRIRRNIHAHWRLGRGHDRRLTDLSLTASTNTPITSIFAAIDRYREPVEGTPFGRYQLIELLGRGGMGEVWRAHDTDIDRVVALKMLLPHYAQDADFEKRFRREARAAGRLDDPHVVPIYDVGEIDGRLYVTMRLINGVDLQTLLESGPLEPARAVHIVEQIASALHSAHQAGLVHRDVKPSNILLTENDFAYLIDFGIARGAGDTALTSANTTVGTWAYMAPERFSTGEIQPSSDIYALACVLYQCLTGQPPYPGDTLEQVAVGHMVAPPPRPSGEHDTIPTAMDQVIATGLAKQPTDRYPTAVEMAAAARHAITASTDPVGATGPTQPTPMSPVPAPWPDAAKTQTSHGDTPPTTPAHFGGPPPMPPPAGKGRRRGVLIGALVAVAVLVAGGVIAAANLSRDEKPAAATPSSAPTASPPAPAPNTGPFTGIYRADFDRATRLDGVGDPSAAPSAGTYGLHSVCRPGGCVATASKFTGDVAFAPTMVFDQVGESWVAVALAPSPCKNTTTETWHVFTLQPRPDGSLAGEYIRLTDIGCQEKRAVTFTRTGDVDVNADFNGLPDPAKLPPRVVSPAEALRGRYRITRTFTGGGPQVLGDSAVTTYCLRAGDRCMSYFSVASGDIALVFGGSTWIEKLETDGPCPTGEMSHLTVNAQFPLPQPPRDAISELTGNGTWIQTASCAVNIGFNETFTRTGD
jgi:serine/threonine protein kinase